MCTVATTWSLCATDCWPCVKEVLMSDISATRCSTWVNLATNFTARKRGKTKENGDYTWLQPEASLGTRCQETPRDRLQGMIFPILVRLFYRLPGPASGGLLASFLLSKLFLILIYASRSQTKVSASVKCLVNDIELHKRLIYAAIRNFGYL